MDTVADSPTPPTDDASENAPNESVAEVDVPSKTTAETDPKNENPPPRGWQLAPSPKYRRNRRWLIFSLLALVVSLSAFIWAIISPFRQSQTRVLLVSTNALPSGLAEELLTRTDTPLQRPLREIFRSLISTDETSSPIPSDLVEPASAADWLPLIRTTLAEANLSARDEVFCLTEFPLACRRGSLAFCGHLDPSDSTEGLISLDDVVHTIADATSARVTMFLDFDQVLIDPRSGLLQNGHDTLRNMVSQAISDCPTIRVVIGHSRKTIDNAHASPSFIEVIATGTQGDADVNADGIVNRQEFLDFVSQSHIVEVLDSKGLVNRIRERDFSLPVFATATGQSPSDAENAPTWRVPLHDAKPLADGQSPALSNLSTTELLAKCWRLRDELSAINPTKSLTRRRSKSELAPATWRRLGEQLVSMERLATWPHPRTENSLKPWLLSRCQDLSVVNGETGGLSFVPEWTKRFSCPIGDDFPWDNGVWSLALHESAVALSSESPSSEVTQARQFLTSFDEDNPIGTKGQKTEEVTLGKFAEIDFLNRLNQRPGLTDSQIRLVTETRILAEQLAASSEATTWFADEIIATDRSRILSERLLLEGVEAKMLDRGAAVSRDCLSQYRTIATKTRHVTAAYETRNATLRRISCYRKLANHFPAANQSLDEAFSNLVQSLRHLLTLLDAPNSRQVAELGRARRAVQAAETHLRQILYLDGDSKNNRLPATVQLRGDLFSTNDRLKLWQEWFDRQETVSPSNENLSNPSPAYRTLDFHPVSLEALMGRCRREVAFAQLLQPISRMNHQPNDVTTQLQKSWTQLERAAADWNASDETTAESVFRDRLNAFADQLEACHGKISTTLINVAVADEHDVAHLLPLIDPRDEVPPAVEEMTKRIRQAEWMNVLKFQLRRRLCFDSDANSEELAGLRREKHVLLQSLIQMNPDSPVTVAELPLNSELVIDDVSDNAAGKITWRLQLHNRSAVTLPVWLWMSRLPREVKCTLSPELPTQVVTGTSNKLPFPPYTQNEQNAVQSLILDAGERREVIGTLQIARGYITPGRLAIRLVTPTLRKESNARIPQDAFHTTRVEVPWLNGNSALAHWAPSANGILDRSQTVQWMRGWPNQLQRCVCRLANPGSTERIVEVRCYRYPADDELTIPKHTLSRQAANDLLLSLGLDAPLFAVSSLNLPTDGSAVPIPFPKTKMKQPLDISRGLLLVIRDSKTFETCCLIWHGSPRDPLASIETRVDYDATRRQMEARFRWRDDLPIPAEGIPVRMSLRNPDDHSVLGYRSGVVMPDQPEQKLVLTGIDDRWQQYRVTLDVAGWPRILHYDVDTNHSAVDITASAGPTAIQFVSPVTSTALSPSIRAIPVQLRVDAPRRRLEGGPIRLSIGLDRLQSRWPEDQVIHFDSDRQIRSDFHGITNDGEIIWESRVTDFDFQFPLNPTGETRANLVAVVQRHDQQARTFVPLIFDGEGPKIRGVEILSPAEMLVDSTVTLSIEADDEGLSGTDRVEAIVDVERSGEFPPGEKPKLAVLSDEGRWIVQVPMKGLPAGVSTVLVRGIDIVGNIGSTFSKSIELLDAEEITRRRQAAYPDVTGRVVYVNQPVGRAEVKLIPVPPKNAKDKSDETRTELSTETNDDGAFLFRNVPPGEWKVEVAGSISGFRSQATWPIEVASDAANSPLLLDFTRPPNPEESTKP